MNMEQRQRIMQSIEKRHLLLAWAEQHRDDTEALRLQNEIAALEGMLR